MKKTETKGNFNSLLMNPDSWDKMLEESAIVQEIGKIYETNNYSIFSLINGNREIDRAHVAQLKYSIKNYGYLNSPITVNKKFEIIDGQHRFTAAKELNLPIRYIIQDNYGLNEVQIMNTNGKNWRKSDYLESYCDRGNSNYLKLKKFMNEFPEFGISSAESILTNCVGGINNRGSVDGDDTNRVKNFQNGNLVISDENLKNGIDIAKKIQMFKPYYDGYNRRIFVSAMIGIFKNENYNHNQMIQKLNLNSTVLKHCSNVMQYKECIEQIYNYKTREKVSLRY